MLCWPRERGMVLVYTWRFRFLNFTIFFYLFYFHFIFPLLFIYPRHLPTPTPTTHDPHPRPTTFSYTREKPAHTQDTPHVQPLSCKLEWTNQKHFFCFFVETNQRQSCSRVPQTSCSLTSTCAEELWVEIGAGSKMLCAIGCMFLPLHIQLPSANEKIRIFRCVQSHWMVTN